MRLKDIWQISHSIFVQGIGAIKALPLLAKLSEEDEEIYDQAFIKLNNLFDYILEQSPDALPLLEVTIAMRMRTYGIPDNLKDFIQALKQSIDEGYDFAQLKQQADIASSLGRVVLRLDGFEQWLNSQNSNRLATVDKVFKAENLFEALILSIISSDCLSLINSEIKKFKKADYNLKPA